MNHSSYPKIGLALGSGGAKGLAHIGVIKMLEKNKIPIDYIAGSSIGAVIGAHYATFKDIKKLEDLVVSLTLRKGFQLFDPTIRGGFIKGKKFEFFLKEILERADFKNLRIPFAAVATDFHTAKPVIFTNGDLVKAIHASISVPTIFQPVFYKDKHLADGGLSNSVPVDIVRKMGADIVLAVNLDTVSIENGKLLALTKLPMHSINILRHNLAIQSTKTADVIIAPKGIYQIGLIGWNYFFDTEKTKQVIHAGEKATEEVIPEIENLIKEINKAKQSRWKNFFSFFKKFTP
ncbi:MAG TPA: patatin-like phospholipase family protein [Methylomirabilota bacterium]|nr:patatin-like phospholipase family protein [Methylomirabilota bacterium]